MGPVPDLFVLRFYIIMRYPAMVRPADSAEHPTHHPDGVLFRHSFLVIPVFPDFVNIIRVTHQTGNDSQAPVLGFKMIKDQRKVNALRRRVFLENFKNSRFVP